MKPLLTGLIWDIGSSQIESTDTDLNSPLSWLTNLEGTVTLGFQNSLAGHNYRQYQVEDLATGRLAVQKVYDYYHQPYSDDQEDFYYQALGDYHLFAGFYPQWTANGWVYHVNLDS